MNEIRVYSLFSGIGSPEKALDRQGIHYKLAGFSEIDASAIKSYCAIRNVSESLNFGDISVVNDEFDFSTLPQNINLISHGSPCQDYSKAGKNDGGDEGSETRSSLMWKTVKIVSKLLPDYVIWENVPNVISKRHVHNYNKYLSEMESLGYINYAKPILNAVNYGIPQNRERVFVLSIRNDIDDGTFTFPTEEVLTKKLLDLLEDEVDEKYYLSEEKQNELIHHIEGNQIYIKNATKLGYLPANHGDGIDLGYPTSKTRRGRVQQQRSQTLVRNSNLGVLLNGRIRRFTPLEAFRLMGFDDQDYYKAKSAGIKDSQLYNQAGNSIVVNVMEAIFKQLFKVNT